MRVIDHRLAGINFIKSPNVSGSLVNPTLLVLHYTASGDSVDGDALYFKRPEAKASAHLVIERDGRVTQCVDFNRVAWHAGVSSWNGKSGANSFSIGIEIDNWGLLEKRANGNYYSHAGTQISADRVFVGPNKLGNGKYWETYPSAQLAALEKCIEAILKAYPSITKIVGHEDIAPRRKIDPGPALYQFIDNMNSKYLSNRKDSPTRQRTVTATPHLNVRSSPNGLKVAEILTGKIVEVMYTEGDWARIVWPSGWVHKNFLR